MFAPELPSAVWLLTIGTCGFRLRLHPTFAARLVRAIMKIIYVEREELLAKISKLQSDKTELEEGEQTERKTLMISSSRFVFSRICHESWTSAAFGTKLWHFFTWFGDRFSARLATLRWK